MSHLGRNLLLGLAGGVAGTAAMGAYWMALGKIKPGLGATGEEPGTVRVARRALRRAGVKSPSKQTRAVGGQAVHWSYGASWGLVAGASRAMGLPLDWGGGQLFGAALWAFGDLWMVYQLGFARHPREYPVQVHASALGAHLAYGFGLWAAMEGLGQLDGPARKRLRRVA